MNAGRASWLAAPCAHGVPSARTGSFSERTLSIAKKILCRCARLDIAQGGRRTSGRCHCISATPRPAPAPPIKWWRPRAGLPGRALRLWGRRRRIDTPVPYAFLAGNRALSVLVDIFKGTSGRMRQQERPDLAARYRKKGLVWSPSNNNALSPRHKMARFRRGAL